MLVTWMPGGVALIGGGGRGGLWQTKDGNNGWRRDSEQTYKMGS